MPNVTFEWDNCSEDAHRYGPKGPTLIVDGKPVVPYFVNVDTKRGMLHVIWDAESDQSADG